MINSLELTDHILLSNGEKIIITTGTRSFLRRPDALFEWIDAPAREVLCVYEKEPYEQSEFLARVGSKFPPHVTLGLACFPRYLVDAAEIEKLVAQADESTDPWYLGQTRSQRPWEKSSSRAYMLLLTPFCIRRQGCH